MDNVFHCCVFKTASQWLRGILRDPVVYRYSGLTHHHYQSEMPGGYDPRPVLEREFDKPFPKRTIAGPLYITHEAYDLIPRPQRFATFFVTRDPRDLVVSGYFSTKYSHGPRGRIKDRRELLNAVGESEGLRLFMDMMDEAGIFETLRSWVRAATDDDLIKIFRYEDLTGAGQLGALQSLTKHCDIRIPDSCLRDLADRHSFERLSGRQRGSEDLHAHYRKGVAGDWTSKFDETTLTYFDELAGDVADDLGYK
jgi:hypothetical protein